MNDYYNNYCYKPNFEPTHNFRWAKAKARQGCHLTCDELPENARMVYTGRKGDEEFTIHLYDKYGLTIQILRVTEIDEQSTTWRLYGKPEEFPLVPFSND